MAAPVQILQPVPGQKISIKNLPEGHRPPVSVTIVSPKASSQAKVYLDDRALTIKKIVVTVKGSSSPSVAWTLRYDTDRSATGTEINTGGKTTTNTTTGEVIEEFDNDSVPADSHMWMEISTVSGTVEEISINIFYTLN